MRFQSKLIVLSIASLCLLSCKPATDSSPAEDTAADGAQLGVPTADYPMLPLQRLMAPASFTVPQISPDGQLISWIASKLTIRSFFSE